jgi:hypothetical protein
MSVVQTENCYQAEDIEFQIALSIRTFGGMRFGVILAHDFDGRASTAKTAFPFFSLTVIDAREKSKLTSGN